jgi:hypothetical protein
MKALKVLIIVLLATFSYSALSAQSVHHKRYHKRHHVAKHHHKHRVAKHHKHYHKK